MSEKILIFGNNGINRNTFPKRVQSIGINKLDLWRIVMSNKKLYSKNVSFK